MSTQTPWAYPQLNVQQPPPGVAWSPTSQIKPFQGMLPQSSFLVPITPYICSPLGVFAMGPHAMGGGMLQAPMGAPAMLPGGAQCIDAAAAQMIPNQLAPMIQQTAPPLLPAPGMREKSKRGRATPLEPAVSPSMDSSSTAKESLMPRPQETRIPPPVTPIGFQVPQVQAQGQVSGQVPGQVPGQAQVQTQVQTQVQAPGQAPVAHPQAQTQQPTPQLTPQLTPQPQSPSQPPQPQAPQPQPSQPQPSHSQAPQPQSPALDVKPKPSRGRGRVSKYAIDNPEQARAMIAAEKLKVLREGPQPALKLAREQHRPPGRPPTAKIKVHESEVGGNLSPIQISDGYKCAFCDKSMRSRQHCRRHMRTHFDSKSHACARCGKQFHRKDTRDRHQFACRKRA